MIVLYKKYAKVYIDNKVSNVDKLFTYGIGDNLLDSLQKGMRVLVPFGGRNRLIKGFVVDLLDKADGDYKVKGIIEVLDSRPLVSDNLIELALWMKDNYLSTYMEAFQTVLPPGDYKSIQIFLVSLDREACDDLTFEETLILKEVNNRRGISLDQVKKDSGISNVNILVESLISKGYISTYYNIETSVNVKYEKWVKLREIQLEPNEIDVLIGKRAKKQREVYDHLLVNGKLSLKDILKDLNTTSTSIKSLEDKGLVDLYEMEVIRNPIKKKVEKYLKHQLTGDQKNVFSRIMGGINKETASSRFLIHGITGSGKTEIYLQVIEEILKQGRDSIYLIPEISLTPQTIDRFMGRFGERIAILHSRLSYGERFDQWRRIKDGEVKIVVGARSAIFAPFSNLGLIVIDEEHENTYKSSQNPKYDTIEVAEKRISIENATLVIGSATPSLESYYKSKNGYYELLDLKERINSYSLPEVQVVDMREELNNGNKSILSQVLYDSILDNLEKKKQTILFLNRRGFSTFVSCRNCGYVVKCHNCDISMTYHHKDGRVKCHYCGLAEDPPSLCPDCGSEYIKYFGVGTERVENYIRKIFPTARLARLDLDTTTRKGSYESILGDMKDGKIDILIGTQMISKGLDFKNVTLVGIIAADISLNLPDFRAPEKTFQLVTQVSGRAGRGQDEGKVILQTYNPSHYSIEYSKDHDYNKFYEDEIRLREEFLYPPIINLVSILIYGENLEKVISISKKIYSIIIREAQWIGKDTLNSFVIGPNPAPIEKIKNNYRWQIIIKSNNNHMKASKDLIKRVCIDNENNLDLRDIKISISINPNSIM